MHIEVLQNLLQINLLLKGYLIPLAMNFHVKKLLCSSHITTFSGLHKQILGSAHIILILSNEDGIIDIVDDYNLCAIWVMYSAGQPKSTKKHE